MTMPWSSVTRSMESHGGIRLSGFVLAGLFIANENVDLLYFGGPWTDYQCRSETSSNCIIISEYIRPRPMWLSWFLEFDVQCEVLFFQS